MEIGKTRPVPQNTWYQWFDWLISYILESRKSESDAKHKIRRLFESKIYSNTHMGYNQKKLQMSLKVDLLNTKVTRIKNYQ